MSHEIIERRLNSLHQNVTDLKTLVRLMIKKPGLKPEWVYAEEACAITGLCKRKLEELSKKRNPKTGIFHVSCTGKKYRYYVPDLEKYVHENSTLTNQN